MARIGLTKRTLAGTKRQAMERQTLERIAVSNRFGRARAPFSVRTSRGVLSGVVVSVIREWADEETYLDNGRVALRLSAHRRRQPEVAERLGPHLERAARVCLIWDLREDQMVEVREDRAADLPAEDEDSLWDYARAERMEWSAAA
jgi:hypothetical protein